MRRFIIFAAFIVLSVFFVTSVVAQSETCSSFVNQALEQLSANCGNLERNNACYGFNNVQATFFDALSPDAFDQPNDRVALSSLQSITTTPLNTVTQEWGIAVVKAQANLPDALPGQAVTFLLMGDVQLTTGVEQDSDQNPMQAIYFTTGINDTRCSEAPDSALIIQGPENITVNLKVNGANISLGSTLIFRSSGSNSMECGVLDGQAVVGATQQVIPAGFEAEVALDDQLNVKGTWGENEPLGGETATALQILRDIPEGVMNYTPNVPTADDIRVLAALNTDLITALDAHIRRDLVRLLLVAGADPESLAEWDVQQLRDYVASNAETALLATAEPVATEDSVPTAPLTQEAINLILTALDTYLNQQE